jgi:vacuolar iron transporter family protein
MARPVRPNGLPAAGGLWFCTPKPAKATNEEAGFLGVKMGADEMKSGSTWQRLRDSIVKSAGTIVFGMEDGTVSIFGLIFGVAATTTSTKTVLIAGASGAAAAAVSMMAGAYLDAETTQDQSDATMGGGKTGVSLSNRLLDAGLSPQQSSALTAAVENDRHAADGLLLALTGGAKQRVDPVEQALWMLFADFFAAAVPILPFVFLPIGQARIVSGTVTVALLIALGVGRAQLGQRNVLRTVAETVSLGIGAAAAGVAIGVLIDRLLS